MPPVILTLLQGLFLLLLYVFVARAVRAVLRDIRSTPAAPPRPVTRSGRSAGAPSTRGGRDRRGGDGSRRQRNRLAEPAELVVHKPDGRPEVVPLDDDVVFGRAGSATVVLSDPYVSDEHARVYHDGREWILEDLGSTNGTFLNQSKLGAPTPIAAGDQLAIGRTVVEVRR